MSRKLKTVPTVELVKRLSALSKEYDEIIFELWDRIPPLKDEPQLQPKGKVKELKRDELK